MKRTQCFYVYEKAIISEREVVIFTTNNIDYAREFCETCDARTNEIYIKEVWIKG